MNCAPFKSTEIREERLETGEVLIQYPIRVRPWIAKVGRLFGATDEPVLRKLQLDPLGAEVWAMIDGKTTVRRMVAEFRKVHDAALDDTEIAVSRFIRDLGRRGIVGIK